MNSLRYLVVFDDIFLHSLILIVSYYNAVSNYSLWNTNDTTTDADVTGAIDFRNEFHTLYQDPTRMGYDVGETYKFRVSFRPSIGYLRVKVTNSQGDVVQDTGDIWDLGSISSVCCDRNCCQCVYNHVLQTPGKVGVWTFIQSAVFTNTGLSVTYCSSVRFLYFCISLSVLRWLLGLNRT